jgi:RNA polymerase sigma-70 factor (ECF subfamily)
MLETLIDLPAQETPAFHEESVSPAERDENEATLPGEVLRRVQAHDPEGWQLLLHLYGPVVHSWCRRWGLQAADVADIVQEVFCALMRRVEQFRLNQGGGLRGWIWTITQNKLKDHQRARARAPRTGEDVHRRLLDIAQPEPGEAGPAGGRQELFHRALLVLRSEFEERTWQAFWRSVVDEQASTTVGEELDMTPNAVRKARSRVLKRLREVLVNDREPAC